MNWIGVEEVPMTATTDVLDLVTSWAEAEEANDVPPPS